MPQSLGYFEGGCQILGCRIFYDTGRREPQKSGLGFPRQSHGGTRTRNYFRFSSALLTIAEIIYGTFYTKMGLVDFIL